jgi:hypothetical protein
MAISSAGVTSIVYRGVDLIAVRIFFKNACQVTTLNICGET